MILTNPPSPLPFNSLDEDDLVSTTSKESMYSYKSKSHSVQYDFLKFDSSEDDHPYSLSKRRVIMQHIYPLYTLTLLSLV